MKDFLQSSEQHHCCGAETADYTAAWCQRAIFIFDDVQSSLEEDDSMGFSREREAYIERVGVCKSFVSVHFFFVGGTGSSSKKWGQ